jgi:hypothetical protein
MLAKERGIDAVGGRDAGPPARRGGQGGDGHGQTTSTSRNRSTWSVHEARALRETALKNKKLVTQMGNQGHSSDGARLSSTNGLPPASSDRCARCTSGRTVPPATGRSSCRVPATPFHFRRPRRAMAPATCVGQNVVNGTLARAMGQPPVPEGLRWDLYLGPVAEDIPYHPIYHPFNWRGWIDSRHGRTGRHGRAPRRSSILGARLTYPTSIEATSSPLVRW